MIIWSSDDAVFRHMLTENAGRETTCFLCGQPLTLPLITWSGVQQHLFMHPECVMRRMQTLGRDLCVVMKYDGLHADENVKEKPQSDVCDVSKLLMSPRKPLKLIKNDIK